MQFVCETKEAGGDLYYRFSEERMLTWLAVKVDRLVARDMPLPEAIGLVAQYTDKQYESRLESLYG